MAIPTLVAIGPENATGSSLNASWPAGHQAGDLGILIVETANEAIGTPSGWTQVSASPQGAGTSGVDATATRLSMFWRIAGSSSEPNATASDPGDHLQAYIVVFRGVHQTSPIHAADGDVSASPTTSMDSPAVTTSVNDCLIISAGAEGVDNSVSRFNQWVSNGGLSDFDVILNDGNPTSNGGGLILTAGGLATAGDSGTISYGLLTSSFVGVITAAIRPPDPVGSGSPTATLAASASGTAEMTPPVMSGSGSPVGTLSAFATGEAVMTVPDVRRPRGMRVIYSEPDPAPRPKIIEKVSESPKSAVIEAGELPGVSPVPVHRPARVPTIPEIKLPKTELAPPPLPLPPARTSQELLAEEAFLYRWLMDNI